MVLRRAFSNAIPGNGLVLSQNQGQITGVVKSWQYSGTTTEADPGNGYLRFNNASPASATEAYVDDIDGQGNDVAGTLQALEAGSIISFVAANDPSQFLDVQLSAISAETGYTAFTFTVLSGSPAFIADETLAVQVSPVAGALLADGSTPMTGDLDMDGNDILDVGEIIGQTAVVNVTDAATVAVLNLYGRRANPANGDSITQSFYLRNDALEDVEAGRITWALADETDGTEDSSWRIGVMVGGTLTDRFLLSSGGAGPHLRPINNNTLHLGTGAFGYASLYLGSGAAINWNNGDITITHSSNLLTLAGGNLGLGTNNITSVGSVVASGPIGAGVFTVGTLPSASTAGASARAQVTDANATTFASVVAGGGANAVPVYSDGTNWRIG